MPSCHRMYSFLVTPSLLLPPGLIGRWLSIRAQAEAKPSLPAAMSNLEGGSACGTRLATLKADPPRHDTLRGSSVAGTPRYASGIVAFLHACGRVMCHDVGLVWVPDTTVSPLYSSRGPCYFILLLPPSISPSIRYLRHLVSARWEKLDRMALEVWPSGHCDLTASQLCRIEARGYRLAYQE